MENSYARKEKIISFVFFLKHIIEKSLNSLYSPGC